MEAKQLKRPQFRILTLNLSLRCPTPIGLGFALSLNNTPI